MKQKKQCKIEIIIPEDNTDRKENLIQTHIYCSSLTIAKAIIALKETINNLYERYPEIKFIEKMYSASTENITKSDDEDFIENDEEVDLQKLQEILKKIIKEREEN